MTQREALQVLAVLRAAFPEQYLRLSKEEAIGVVNTWAAQFASIPVDIVVMAVQKLIASSDKMPKICDVKEKLRSMHWEAYNVISNKKDFAQLSEQQQAFYQRVHDTTENGRFSLVGEPSLRELYQQSESLKLIGGAR